MVVKITVVAGLLSGGLTLILLLAAQYNRFPFEFALVALNTCLGGLFAAGAMAKKSMTSRLTDIFLNIPQSWYGQNAATFEIPEAPEIEVAVRKLANSVQERVDDLRDKAHRDILTHLCNRVQFQKNVEAILNSASSDFQCALFFIDMDGFKAVNDTFGHHIGDRLLQIVADRLRIATKFETVDEHPDPHDRRAFSSIARFGGDEFVFFMAQSGCVNDAARIASRIVRVMAEPFEIGPHTVSVSGSVGIALYPKNGRTYAELLRSADTAMYHAKRLGRSRYEFYDPVMDIEARELAEAEQELREAVIRGNLELHYQPLFNLHSMQLTSAEALIRWNHPRKGLLLPQQFMHLADRADLVTQIGEWVINEAVKRIAEFERTGSPLQISINISPRHLERVDFIPTVKAAITRWKIEPSLLQIEVTEEIALRDPEQAADRLRQLADFGVTIAIDDFGTGYSNLASLTMLPISKLKIDKSLLQDITIRPEARVLVQTIISMANSLGFHSIAEGVETEEQLELLSAMGCDAVQGFLLSRPLQLDDLRQAQNSGKFEGPKPQKFPAAA